MYLDEEVKIILLSKIGLNINVVIYQILKNINHGQISINNKYISNNILLLEKPSRKIF